MMSKSLWAAVCVWFSHVMVQGQLTGDANCTVDSSDLPELQSGINNYVIDMLGSMQFAYAIDQCTATNLINVGKWYMYQCDMDTSGGMPTVTKTEFFDDNCATNGIVIQTFNETNMTEGSVGSFECSGYNTYAKTIWSLDADCNDEVVIYAALGACTNIGGSSQLNFYCSSNETIAQVFNLGGGFPTSTYLPSSSFFPNATLPSLLNATLPSLLNATLPSLLNATLPSLLNATLPSLLNATLPSLINATLPSLLNETMLTTTAIFNVTFPILNMTTTQFAGMMCADDAFCDKWLFSPDQCQMVTMMQISGTLARVYGRMEECSTDIGSSTMIETTGLNISVTEPNITVTEPTTGSSTSTTGASSSTTNMQTTSGAIRPSLLFTVGVLSSFFFLVSV